MATRHPDRAPYLFAGDRSLAVRCLDELIAQGDPPEVVVVHDGSGASHAEELVDRAAAGGVGRILRSSELADRQVLDELRRSQLELALNVHLPVIIRRELLSTPRRGWLNLHPAFLPYNRGWHTPSWAILDGTPAGVSLHRMVEQVDAGEILAQRRVDVLIDDTAHSLYQRLLDAEFELLRSEWGRVRDQDPWSTRPNELSAGTEHRRSELLSSSVRELDAGELIEVGEMLDRLRALTTNTWDEAVRVRVGDRQVLVRVELRADDGTASSTGSG